MMEKLIITVAPVGSVPKKKDTPHVPITPEEIAVDALECYNAGASIVHIHARDEFENSSHDLKIFSEIYKKIQEKTKDMIIQISTGGRAGLGFESRSKALELNPEMASLTTGSCNFPNIIYENSPQLVTSLAEVMSERNIKPELEIFDTSMVDQAVDLYKRGLLKEPLYFNFVMGLKNSQRATFAQLNHLLNLIPKGSIWNISGVGKAQIFTTFMAIALGGHVRVGLEDNIYYSKGVLAKNSDLVKRVVRIAKEFNREIASPKEAREILKIGGLNE